MFYDITVTAKKMYLLSTPKKCRRVCRFPEAIEFSTVRGTPGEPVILTVDESARKALAGKNAEHSPAREENGTKIYETAREKPADALVLDRSPSVEGGDCDLCNGNSEFCYKRDCAKRQQNHGYTIEKGVNTHTLQASASLF